jgi:hypothetical protein
MGRYERMEYSKKGKKVIRARSSHCHMANIYTYIKYLDVTLFDLGARTVEAHDLLASFSCVLKC